jgi:hypothetical protein
VQHQHSYLEMNEDSRRLSYLACLGEYRPPRDGAPAFSTWVITAPSGVSLRQQLDRLRAGLKYGQDNKPIEPHPGLSHDSAARIAAEKKDCTCCGLPEPIEPHPGETDPFHIDERISGDGPMPRDPMDQDHSVSR